MKQERVVRTNFFYRLVLVPFLAFLAACSGSNLFGSFDDSTTDEALLFEAKQQLDQEDFSGAITSVESMTSAGQATNEALVVKASAFGGRCGLNFLDFVTSISESSSDPFFVILMKAMVSSTSSKGDDCIAAMDLINQISTSASSRETDQNLLMALLGLASIGSILNVSADTDDDDSVDSTFNHCSTISDDDMKQLIVSMSETFNALEAIGSASTLIGSELDDLGSACDSLAAVSSDLDFCGITDTDDVTANHILGMRGVVGSEESIGLGDSAQSGCGDSGQSITDCVTSCP